MIRFSSLFLIIVAFVVSASAQQTSVLRINPVVHPNYFDAKLFDPAYNFNERNSATTFEESEKLRQSVFSGLNIHKPFAEIVADSFAQNNPYYFVRNRVELELGNYHFGNENFEAAYQRYSQTDNSLLSNKEIAEKNFRIGYAALTLGLDSVAHSMFATVKDITNEYSKPENYYYALLEYFNKNYDTAYARFKLIEKEMPYKNVVPFYLAEIKYLQNDKKSALEIAKTCLADTTIKPYYINEIHQLVGQIYFEMNSFDHAIPYLEYYNQNSTKLRREDIFELGYSYYQTGKIERAAQEFVKVYEKEDYIAELALYLLGDCYLKSQKKDQARIAFKEATVKNVSKSVNENARFLFSKLSYELGFDEDALNGAYNLVNKYPDTKYKDQAYKMMADLMLTSNNYESTLSIIKEMEANEDMNKTHQWVSFNNGLALLKEKKYDMSVNAFNESLRYQLDPLITSLTRFWLAEACYHQNQMPEAIANAKAYLNLPVTEGLASIHNANTLLAYAYLKQNDLVNAKEYIRKIIISDDDKNRIDTAQQNILSRLLYNINKNENALNDSLFYAYQLTATQPELTLTILRQYEGNPTLNDFQRNLYYTAMGNALLQTKDTARALLNFSKVIGTKNDKYSNEGIYQLATTSLAQAKKENAVAVLDKAIQNTSMFDEWMGQIYLLRSRIYEDESDYLNASSLLKSVVDNCESATVAELAIDRLKLLNSQAIKQFGIINGK